MKTFLAKVRFVHVLSLLMVAVSGAGGFIVLLGNGGFSAEMKGAVVTLMLIGGWTAVQNFWLGSSAGSERKDRMAASDRAARQDGDV